LLTRLRYAGSPETMVDQDGDTWVTKQDTAHPARHEDPKRLMRGHHDPGVQEAPTPIAAHWCETRQPRCGLSSSSVSTTIFGRKAQHHSGHRKVQEANAASRKERENHSPADRVYCTANALQH